MTKKLATGVMEKPVVEQVKKMTKEELLRRIPEMRARDARLVTGIFENRETPGGGVRFNFKMYKGDEYVTYELFDGERYQLPYGVARHLNNSCFFREWSHLPSEMAYNAVADGRMQPVGKMMESKKKHRFSFRSLEYMDDDADFNPVNLIEAQFVAN